MTLEDFFTLTEMKDGLATSVRVEELISVMQKQEDIVMNNVGDASRQWSTVAGILAATENIDCLNHFIQLNGLCFLNQRLLEVQKCSNNVSDSAVEDLISTLLGSLERLPIDREKSTASGIGATVEQLLGHKSLNVQERARTLFDKWNQLRDNAVSCKALENGGRCEDDQPKPSADANTVKEGDTSPCKRTDKGCCGLESEQMEPHHSNVTRCSDNSHLDASENVRVSIPNQTMPASLNSADANAVLEERNSFGSSPVSNPCHENLSTTEESSICPAVALPSSGTCSSPIGRVGDVDDHRAGLTFRDAGGGVKETEVELNGIENSSCRYNQKEVCNVSASGLSASNHAQKPAMGPSVSSDIDSKESESCISKAAEPQPKNWGADCGIPKYMRTKKEPNPVGHVEMGFQDLSSNMCILRERDGAETSCYRKEAVGNEELDAEANLRASRVDPESPCGPSKSIDSKKAGGVDLRSELGLEYGEIDALEVARQVAIEVEREVVDYREPFCSSSPDVNSGEIAGTDFVEGKKDDSVTEELSGKGSLPRKDFSDSTSLKGGSPRISENIRSGPEEHEQELESPNPASVVQEPVGKIDRTICDFDLNEDVCTEDFSCSTNLIPSNSVNLSAPIAVTASKGAPGLPVTPLQFEGELGWKGSAATSAFRPASPRRTPEGEKTYSGSKRKHNFLEIDLNVAESGDDMAVDPISVKQLPVSSGLPSGDSSMEVSSRRAERLKLDLNRIGDQDPSPNPTLYWRLHHQNGDQSLSPASSSSSRQPYMRNFDLNDNPSFFDAGDSHNPDRSLSKESETYGSYKLDDPVIKIMGSRMAVERKDYANYAHQSFLPYAHMPPPAYGYNGLAVGPVISMPPALYGTGSIPYMIDSRGATVIPQVLGSSVGLNCVPSSRPPFFMGFNGVGSSRPALDLNSGMSMVPMESGSKEAGSLKQLFMQGHSGLTEEPTKAASQHANSGMASKWKEPECGWEPSGIGYKQVTSWQ